MSFDKIFSYWVVLWILIYILAFYNQDQSGFDFIYENCNPFILLVIGLISNTILLIFIFIYNPKLSLIIKFSIMYVLLKLIPLYLLLLYSKIKVLENILFSFFYFVIYNVYLFYKKTNIIEVYSFVNYYVIYDSNKTPLLRLMSNLLHK